MKRWLVFVLLLCSGIAFAQDAGTTDGTSVGSASGSDEPKPKPKKKKHKKTKSKDDDKYGKTEDEVEGGKHWRIDTDHGAVHVWVPPGYDRSTAGTVVYVHGYYVDVDQAWADYDLAKQFKESKQNAIFIVPEAPAGRDEEVYWKALADLRKAVTKANIKLPDGPTIVIGHSGAFRTMSQWVDHKLVAELILLDALYGKDESFDDFIGTGKRAKYHKMILIGDDTAAEGTEFIKKYPFAVVRDKMPDSTADFSKKEKKAKLLYVKSQYGHMEIVTSGKVIPLLLRLTPLKAR
jgi:hypothetical protein